MTNNINVASDSMNSSIDCLELRLAELANAWRKTHSEGRFQASQEIVAEYHSVFEKLWTLGWSGEGLLPDSELPEALMPKYFTKG